MISSFMSSEVMEMEVILDGWKLRKRERGVSLLNVEGQLRSDEEFEERKS